MEFKIDDENYVYELIGKNVKKYRKLKGWTQEKLAREINYSLSFISGMESAYHQTFSLGAIWRISRVLGIEFYRLCEDNTEHHSKKYINCRCNKCKTETKIPIQIAKHFKNMYEIMGSDDLPRFECTDCDGYMTPIDPTEF